jgi:hypothetical protein
MRAILCPLTILCRLALFASTGVATITHAHHKVTNKAK